ncbi:BRO-N domain-containing protein [Sedimentimonas flavescens]|uniref:BRO-N domain-containing protein n=1 Tax=Sedimentimonas flavescens TaxID=2851012 RepID=UPI0021A7D896|nr:BRO family protein [Sedimentimonas flavescens]MCT2541267.1 BRO family protein [Sedimentimonas flavescens]
MRSVAATISAIRQTPIGQLQLIGQRLIPLALDAPPIPGKKTMSQFKSFIFNSITTGPRAIRVLEIYGEPWFVAKDVCDALGLRNVTRTVAPLYPEEVCRMNRMDLGEERNGSDMPVVSASGLYELLRRSDRPATRAFQYWITATVMPAFRDEINRIKFSGLPIFEELAFEAMVAHVLDVSQARIASLEAEIAFLGHDADAPCEDGTLWFEEFE